jgi:tetratricopeptide (TPR) repeat protein
MNHRWKHALAARAVSTASLVGAYSLAGGQEPAVHQGVAQTREPLFPGMGPHKRKVTTKSPLAQRYFDQGLNQLYGFNHDEAIRSFKQAAELDPSCAMAWWGIAVANGPHINNPMVPAERERAAVDAINRAQQLAAAHGATAAEKALIQAVAKRHAWPQPKDRGPLDRAYAAAMRKVWTAHPSDADAGALAAEAMMDLRPWDLWKPNGAPHPGTAEIVAILERALKVEPNHPLANHLYIHAVEASPTPGRADAAANRLRNLQPGIGHNLHMPSHIDVQRGRWKEAVESNERAMAADAAYRKIRPRQNFYRLYMLHNNHMLAFAAMMRGQGEKAIKSVDTMVAGIPEEWKRENAGIADGFLATPVEVRIRFGKWDEILDAPEPADIHPIAHALWRHARGVAFAAKGQTKEARAELEQLDAERARLPKTAFFGNNAGADILKVARHMLAGELLIREDRWAEGIAELRKGVRQQDRLRYDEPPGWILPLRHALGAALLQKGRYAEAEKVYREDQKRHPGNGWGLYGLARSLELQGKPSQAAYRQYRQAWKESDTQITSSCLCLRGA